MVTLQILVLPFLVRVRVSQLKAFIFQRWMLFLYPINTLYYFFYVTFLYKTKMNISAKGN